MNFMETIIYIFIKFFLLLVSPLTKTFKWVYNKLPFKVIFKKNKYKLALIESNYRNNMWSYGKKGDEKIIFINTTWKITNALNYNLTALNAYLIKPQKIRGQVILKDVNSNTWGNYALERGYTTEIEISFVVDKSKVKDTNSNINIEFELEDILGKRHKYKNIEIPSAIINTPKKDNLNIEDPSQISNPIIKKVVAVLKNELQQYKVRGRREGRLGTTEWIRGVIEYRNAEEKIKFLFDNSNPKNVTSESLDSLLQLYKSSNKVGKVIVINSLIERLDKKREYRDISYSIVFFLFEIKKLNAGLQVSLDKLQGDKANAFSDVLRLLDFLLAFRYEEFSDKDLDMIESFIYSTKEYPFSIKDRVNAIRVLRIKK